VQTWRGMVVRSRHGMGQRRPEKLGRRQSTTVYNGRDYDDALVKCVYDFFKSHLISVFLLSPIKRVVTCNCCRNEFSDDSKNSQGRRRSDVARYFIPDMESWTWESVEGMGMNNRTNLLQSTHFFKLFVSLCAYFSSTWNLAGLMQINQWW